MANPYAVKGPEQFWRTGVGVADASGITPLRAVRFSMPPGTLISTAGSCFAQNLARHLHANPLISVLEVEEIGKDQPLFSGLYGNIYTARQLVQLFDEAFGSRHPQDIVFQRPDGRYVDGLRPYIFPHGFAGPKEVLAARACHLEAVRRVFAECSVFVFTLGLTEAWRAVADGTVFPVAPGVVSEAVSPPDYEFHNFRYDEVVEDLDDFVGRMSERNPTARVILTVSPVPLTATYTDEHVLVATNHSKAILRAACSAAEARHPAVFYFPAYEIITAPFARGAYYEANLRSITTQGVDHVMRVFEANFLGAAAARPAVSAPASALFSDRDGEVICDEEEIVKSVGFE